MGVPNTRVRYYCLAVHQGLSANRDNVGRPSLIQRSLPTSTHLVKAPCLMKTMKDYIDPRLQPAGSIAVESDEWAEMNFPCDCGCNPTPHQPNHCGCSGAVALEQLVIPSSAFDGRTTFSYDIVSPENWASTTFTKGYGSRMVGRTGPLVELSRAPTSQVAGRADICSHSVTECDHTINTANLDPSRLRLLDAENEKVRHFSPREMLKLHGFPPQYVFPCHLSLTQRFSLIGNSINVDVVSVLLAHLCKGTNVEDKA
eukprot:GHVN01048986.1.p1 GENE.GHVN01048986.1~~GHVN01048986.1.p1  ORF type:complete len:257 (+),score=26.16 GHVN01048986.1:173-943(+)